MNIHEILISLLGAELTFPFDEDTPVYKIEGKMFAITNKNYSYISLKNDPYKNLMLREKYDYIEQGYHLNKQHWISIYFDKCDDFELVEHLIIESYQCVLSKLPKKVRERYL